MDNLLTLKTEALKDILETSRYFYHDLTFICSNGRFSCNSLFIAMMSQTVKKALELSEHEDQVFISLPGFDVKNLSHFFSSLYQGKDDILVSEPVFHLLFDQSNLQISNYKNENVLEDIKNEEYSDDDSNFYVAPAQSCDDDNDINFDIDFDKQASEKLKVKKKRSRKKKEIRRDVKGPHRFPYVNKYCEVCEITFNQATAMWRHVYNHHGPKPELICEHCNDTFEQPSQLVYHKKRYHQEKIPCPDCGELQYTTYMNTHMDIYHKVCEPKTCDYCGKSFTNLAKFRGHIRTHSGVKKSKYKFLEDYEQNCHCNLNFDSQQEKLNHYKLVHLGYQLCNLCQKVVRNISPDGHICAPVIRKQRVGPFICKFCNAEFRTNGALFYHEKSIHTNTPSECDICLKTFRSYLHLKDHMKKVHVEKTACNICGVLVKDIKEHHETVHVDDDLKKFRCEHCGKGFNENQKLSDHKMNVHLKLRPYKCRYGCSMAYNDRSNRNQHEKRKHGQLFAL